MHGNIAIDLKTEPYFSSDDLQYRDGEHSLEAAASSHDHGFLTLSRKD
jgi:hypothetical protein